MRAHLFMILSGLCSLGAAFAVVNEIKSLVSVNNDRNIEMEEIKPNDLNQMSVVVDGVKPDVYKLSNFNQVDKIANPTLQLGVLKSNDLNQIVDSPIQLGVIKSNDFNQIGPLKSYGSGGPYSPGYSLSSNEFPGGPSGHNTPYWSSDPHGPDSFAIVNKIKPLVSMNNNDRNMEMNPNDWNQMGVIVNPVKQADEIKLSEFNQVHEIADPALPLVVIKPNDLNQIVDSPIQLDVIKSNDLNQIGSLESFGFGGPYSSGNLLGTNEFSAGPSGPNRPYWPSAQYGSGGLFNPPELFGPGKPHRFRDVFGLDGLFGINGHEGPLDRLFDPRRQFGVRSFGPPGSIEKFADIHLQLLVAKFKSIALACELMERYIYVVSDLNEKLQLSKLHLHERQKSLSRAIEQQRLKGGSLGNDISKCISTYNSANDEIIGKIRGLEIDLNNDERVASINRTLALLNSHVSSYGDIAEQCNVKYPVFFTHVDDINLCATRQQEALNTQRDSLRASIGNDIIKLQTQINYLIDNVNVGTGKILTKIDNDFSECQNQPLQPR